MECEQERAWLRIISSRGGSCKWCAGVTAKCGIGAERNKDSLPKASSKLLILVCYEWKRPKVNNTSLNTGETMSVASKATHTHTRTHALTHARTHACTHSRTHALMHACTHACTHSRMHALTRACTYTHMLYRYIPFWLFGVLTVRVMHLTV